MNHRIVPLEAGLWLVATPIGSARDITLRALDVLASADLLAAEDTRTARKLMEIHGVPLNGREIVAYHDHSGARTREKLVERIKEGASVAYVSEAGTPLISDPGFALGRDVIAEGLPIWPVPGASAVLSALCVAGLPTDRFEFLGFPPPKKSARATLWAELANSPSTLVLYESPKRAAALFEELAEALGPDRPAALCRELTKRFEETRRGSLAELRDDLAERPPRGECVIVVGRGASGAVSEDDIDTALRAALETMRVKDAATAVAGSFGLHRRDVYQRALALSSGTLDES